MSLQTNSVMREFVQLCSDLWSDWLQPANVGVSSRAPQRLAARKYKITNMISRVTRGFMPSPNVVFGIMPGSYGSFSWPNWRLSIDASLLGKDDITYDDFVELALTCYHESRHSEQFFRIAQGLAAGTLKLPDETKAGLINAQAQARTSNLSVRERARLFEGGASSVATAQDMTGMLSTRLNIPSDIASNAVAKKSQFAAFIALPKPTWFKRDTMLLEVEDWMRECFKLTLGGVGNFAQEIGGKGASGYRFYHDQPTENDAHGIEDTLKPMLTNRIGKNFAMNANKKRTDAVFG